MKNWKDTDSMRRYYSGLQASGFVHFQNLSWYSWVNKYWKSSKGLTSSLTKISPLESFHIWTNSRRGHPEYWYSKLVGDWDRVASPPSPSRWYLLNYFSKWRTYWQINIAVAKCIWISVQPSPVYWPVSIALGLIHFQLKVLRWKESSAS